MVHVDDPPLDTLVGVQLIVPPVPADGVTVYVVCENVTTTVQLLVIDIVVYVLPTKLPLHVPPTEAVYPVFGVIVNCLVPPETTV
ncbi:hypothetical protein ASN18_2569 [Candidatus Magnetominusculus xianensis]|uniref:Secreted protein n=1 Tax=Candidatus Magnetominusculus xianensis TaxID=1748249 RepID=A0ABR5SE92_9BACT|nr:hypothetical protein ASN18_2569 [Candidatus Magnetominusculus xianensis]